MISERNESQLAFLKKEAKVKAVIAKSKSPLKESEINKELRIPYFILRLIIDHLEAKGEISVHPVHYTDIQIVR